MAVSVFRGRLFLSVPDILTDSVASSIAAIMSTNSAIVSVVSMLGPPFISLSRRCPCFDDGTLRAASLCAIRLSRFLYARDAANSKTTGQKAIAQETGRKEKRTESRSLCMHPVALSYFSVNAKLVVNAN